MHESSSHPINSPHDKFFRGTFSHPEAAEDVFQAMLPPATVPEVNWPNLALCSGSFVDEALAETRSDLLYRVRWRGHNLSLYLLFEHKSFPEELRLDLLRYMGAIWQQERKEAGSGQPASPIVPVVLYHGKRPWPYSTQFLDCLAMPDPMRSQLAPLVPDFRHLLLDLNQMPMEAIRGRLVSRLGLTLMKAVREGRALEWMEQFQDLLLELAQKQNLAGQFRATLRYLFQAEASAPSTFRRLTAKLGDARMKESIMTIEEEIKQEGREQGALIGRIQNCEELLDRPVSGLEELAQKSRPELEELLKNLHALLSARVRS